MKKRSAWLLPVALIVIVPIFPEDNLILSFAWTALIGIYAAIGTISSGCKIQTFSLQATGFFLLAIAASCTVGMVYGNSISFISRDILPYLFFLIGLFYSHVPIRASRLLLVLIIVCTLESIISLWSYVYYILDVPDPWKYRSVADYKKITSGFPLIGLGLLAVYMQIHQTRKIGAALTFAVNLVALIATKSRGLYLSAVVFYALISVRIKYIIILMSGVLVAGSAIYLSPALQEFLRLHEMDFGSYGIRSNEIEVAFSSWMDKPIFGHGLGATFYDENVNREKGYIHNLPVYHLWKFGLAGSFILLIPFVLHFIRILTNGRGALSRSAHLRSTYFALLVASFVYVLMNASFKTYYFCFFMGLLMAAMEKLLNEKKCKE